MTAMFIHPFDAARCQVFQKRYCCRHTALEHRARKRVLLLTPVFEPLHKLRHKWQNSGFLIFRRGRPRQNERAFFIQMHVRPGQLLDLAPPQAGVGCQHMIGTRLKMAANILGVMKQKQRTQLNGLKRRSAKKNMLTNFSMF